MTDPKIEAPDRHTAELFKLEQRAQEYLDGWKRAKADYLNLKKQTDKDKQELAQFAQAAAVMQFLPVYTSLKLAAASIPDAQQEVDWARGIKQIQKQFEDVLKSIGLEPIKTVGQQFDPNVHHATEKVKQDGAVSGQIVAETKPGWKIGDRVLEPAQVTVAE